MVDSLSLQRNPDGQWMATNQVLLPDENTNIHLIRQVTRSVKPHQQHSASTEQEPILDPLSLQTKTWSSYIHQFLKEHVDDEIDPQIDPSHRAAPKKIQDLKLWH